MTDHKLRILLVDDDAEIREAMQVALQEEGYELISAANGAEALVRIERDRPALVVLDVVMPVRSGFHVLDRIRAGRGRSPKVIMVTATDEQRHREFAESRGVDAFLTKPFEMDDLIAQVNRLLRPEQYTARG